MTKSYSDDGNVYIYYQIKTFLMNYQFESKFLHY